MQTVTEIIIKVKDPPVSPKGIRFSSNKTRVSAAGVSEKMSLEGMKAANSLTEVPVQTIDPIKKVYGS